MGRCCHWPAYWFQSRVCTALLSPYLPFQSLYAKPSANDLVLKRRRGFVKVAMRTGAALVPVYGFGENATFRCVRERAWCVRACTRMHAWAWALVACAGERHGPPPSTAACAVATAARRWRLGCQALRPRIETSVGPPSTLIATVN